MIKLDLSRAIAERMNITIKQADEFLNVWTDLVGECLEKGEPVQLTGFGSFSLRNIPEHRGRNPKTGEVLTVPACHYPMFKAGKGLKERVAKLNPAVVDAPVVAQPKPAETAPAPSTKPARKKKNSIPPESL